MANQKNIFGKLNDLVDKDGLKSDVKITMTDQTLSKLVKGLILAGGSIALIAVVAKNLLPNKHLARNTKVLLEIKAQLAKG